MLAMNRRALAAAAAATAQAFLLTASLAGGAYAVDRALAAETPARPTLPAPADTDQAAPGPASVPEDEGRVVPAAPPSGEGEIEPAAAPPGETGRPPSPRRIFPPIPSSPRSA